ncbi:MAG TPA: hypothetical protein VMA97_11880 [Streptosporangiaceae bacterium]|nr:hypothetical protein [Streptosporangiaceae bacterium]
MKFGIMRLRRKLGQQDGPGVTIEAVRGFGYRYVVPAPSFGPRAPLPREGHRAPEDGRAAPPRR